MKDIPSVLKTPLTALVAVGLVIVFSAFSSAIRDNGVRDRDSAFVLGRSSSEALSEAVDACFRESTRSAAFRCVREKMPTLVRLYGTAEIMRQLKILDGEKRDQGFDCHGVAHIVGEVSATASRRGIGETLRQCTRDCGFGCFHGTALGGLSRNPKLLDNLDSVCVPFSHAAFPGQELTACQHSLGHGLADFAGRDPQKSLLLCDKLSNGSAREACGTGVLMELIEGPVLDHGDSLITLPDDIPAFCETLPNGYADTCLINVGSYEYKRSGDAKRSFERCGDIPERLRQNCAEDLGTDFHFIFSGDGEHIAAGCRNGNNDQQVVCLKGAVGSGLVTDKSGVLGVALCRAIDSPLQEGCFATLSSSIRQIHGNKQWSSFCDTLNSQERKWCSDIQ